MKTENPDRKRTAMKTEKPDRKRTEPGSAAEKICSSAGACGACTMLTVPYEEQLRIKKRRVEQLLAPFCKVSGIIGMDNPLRYRNKVHAVMGVGRDGRVIAGTYRAGTHQVVDTPDCLISNEAACRVIRTVRDLTESFRIPVYDEDSGRGVLRHVLIRSAQGGRELMVTLVTGTSLFPRRKDFAAELLRRHPEVVTVVQNINGRKTSMILGSEEKVLCGNGYVEEELCGCRFRISPRSFFQVNTVQTGKLYGKAVELAALTGKEYVLDAYCGTGTIGITASFHARGVIGVESNADAVRDARVNAKTNLADNIFFYREDATAFMRTLAAEKTPVDVIFMDPPRAGSTEAFLRSAAALKPGCIVYISCNPETLARDLAFARRAGYGASEAWAVDMFPFTDSIESCVLLERVSGRHE